MVLLITYDLNRPGQNYAGLYDAIKECGAWWHYLDSTWLVSTNFSPSQVWEKLSLKIDKGDRVFVSRLSNNPNYSGILPREAWEWLRARTF